MGCCLQGEIVMAVVRLGFAVTVHGVTLCVLVSRVGPRPPYVSALQLLTRAHPLQCVSQPEVQPGLLRLESSPSPAARAHDLPEHKSNSASSGGGSSCQVPAKGKDSRKGPDPGVGVRRGVYLGFLLF